MSNGSASSHIRPFRPASSQSTKEPQQPADWSSLRVWEVTEEAALEQGNTEKSGEELS